VLCIQRDAFTFAGGTFVTFVLQSCGFGFEVTFVIVMSREPLLPDADAVRIDNEKLAETEKIAQKTFELMTSKLQFTLTLLQFFQDSNDGEIELWKLRQLMEHFGQPTTIGEFVKLVFHLRLDDDGRTYYQGFIGLERICDTECPDDEAKQSSSKSPRKSDASKSPQSPSRTSPKSPGSRGASPRRMKFFERSPLVSKLKKMFNVTTDVQTNQESNTNLLHIFQAFDQKKTGRLGLVDFIEIHDAFSSATSREKLGSVSETILMESGEINYEVLMNLLSKDERNPEQILTSDDQEEACNSQLESPKDRTETFGRKFKKIFSSSESKCKRLARALKPYCSTIGYFIGCDKRAEGMVSGAQLKQISKSALLPDHLINSLLLAWKKADDEYLSIDSLIAICKASLK